MPEKFKALCELVADVPAYPGRLPETAELPAVSFFMVSRVTTRCLEDVVDGVTENWQVRVSAARQMEAREIATRFYRLDGRKTAIYQRIVIDSDSDEPAAEGAQVRSVLLNISATLRGVSDD
ncbi:hypothetical protein QAA19_003442 [Salmonella enterica]|uniref:hypothetical protein n=1 Tax=Salmonella enterica TaxID=28901 RepID=UPI0009AEA174|nr:hypothetical protein [Salmonella enterica]EAA5438677.1 hypothetical protein [Salmonella enterica subsp. diarizonae]EBR3878023.1 hypothetical protein [Salmonella enterica subsp. arizonae]EHG2952310.1 hypothetical protein [Salmonella enterica subsp. diarizonae serovar 53:r:z35]ECE6272359.1 hypothetical protein [Salmonella enterica subsp. diarizonae]ECJ5907270.1 hypothetical protein [Salmonella enterica subsp. diarizonae]